MQSCSVNNCNNTRYLFKKNGKKVAFYKFPVEPYYSKWVEFCKQPIGWTPKKTNGICSNHFKIEDFNELSRFRLEFDAIFVPKLNKNAIPSVYNKSGNIEPNISSTTDPIDVSQDGTSSDGAKNNESKESSKENDELKNKPREISINNNNETVKSTNIVENVTVSQKTPSDHDYHKDLNKLQDPNRPKHPLLFLFENDKLVKPPKPQEDLPMQEKVAEIDKLNGELAELRKQLLAKDTIIQNFKTHAETMRSNYMKSNRECNTLKRELQNFKNSHISPKEVILKMKEMLKEVLTSNQIDIIVKKKQRVVWTKHELAVFFLLRYFGKRSYLCIRNDLKIPCPSIATLNRYAAKLDVKCGILEDILQFMKINNQEFKPPDFATVLCFERMKVTSLYEYDNSADEILEPFKYVQVVMARGIFKNWKQIVYVAFDSKMTKEIFDDLVTKLNSMSFLVCATVCDMGPKNLPFLKELEVSCAKPFYHHSITNQAIHFFSDAFHVLKQIRNWFLNNGFEHDGVKILPDSLGALIEKREHIQYSQFLTLNDLVDADTEPLNVLTATKLLSRETVNCLRNSLVGNNETECLSDFIDVVNNWFDLSNSHILEGDETNLYKSSNHQNQILDRAYEFMKDMSSKSDRPQTFQIALMMNVISLKKLFTDMKARYKDIECMATYKLNQDLLTNLFGQIRASEEIYEHPSPLRVIQHIRMIIMGKRSNLTHQETSNTDQSFLNKEKNEFLMAIGRLPQNVIDEELISERVFRNADLETSKHEDEVRHKIIIHKKKTKSTTTDLQELPSDHPTPSTSEKEDDCLLYILGYIAKKYEPKYLGLLGGNPLNCDTPSFVEQIAHDGFLQPTVYWKKSGDILEHIFKHQQGNEKFEINTNIVQRLYTTAMNTKSVKDSNIPEDVVKSFMKIRTLMRVNYLNMKTLSCYTAHQSIDIVVQPSSSKTNVICIKRKNPTKSSKKSKKIKKD